MLEGDIRACFDRLSHAWLLAHLPLDKKILAQWLKAGYLEKDAFHPTEAGTPQGGIISPVLANLALDGLERQLHARYRHRDNSKPSTGVNLVRFADDFIVSARSREMLADIQRFIADEFLAERGLELSPEKTRLTHIDEGFDFLGQNVRRYNGKLVIQPSKKNRKAFLDKVRAVIKANPTLSAGQLIQKLNPLIRGWANYHRHACSKQNYRYVDYAIFQALWRWARRRHPNKMELDVLPALSVANVRELLQAVMPLPQLSQDQATHLVVKHLVQRSRSTRSRLKAQRKRRSQT